MSSIIVLKELSFINNNNFVDSNYRWKNWVDWTTAKLEKTLQPQKTYILRKKVI